MFNSTETHCCYQAALTRRDKYTKSPDGWYYSGRYRFSIRSATILIDEPCDADTLASAIVTYQRAADLDRAPISDLTLLRVIDNGQAVLHMDAHDVLLRIA